jgi:hypothetical protein
MVLTKESDMDITLRDHIALAALRELIATNVYFQPKGAQSYEEARSELAYIYADAMLKARDAKSD